MEKSLTQYLVSFKTQTNENLSQGWVALSCIMTHSFYSAAARGNTLKWRTDLQKIWGDKSLLLEKAKAARINIFRMTMDLMCNVENMLLIMMNPQGIITCLRGSPKSFTELYSIFKLFVLVFRPPTSLFWFTLSTLMVLFFAAGSSF